MKKLSDFIKQLQDIQTKLNGDISIHISHMQDIKVKMLEDWTLGLEGCGVETTKKKRSVSEILCEFRRKDGDYYIKSDTHAAGFLNSFTAPVSGEYAIDLVFSITNNTKKYRDYHIYLEHINGHRSIVEGTEHQYKLHPYYVWTDSIAKNRYFLKQGDSLEVIAQGDINWNCTIKKD